MENYIKNSACVVRNCEMENTGFEVGLEGRDGGVKISNIDSCGNIGYDIVCRDDAVWGDEMTFDSKDNNVGDCFFASSGSCLDVAQFYCGDDSCDGGENSTTCLVDCYGPYGYGA